MLCNFMICWREMEEWWSANGAVAQEGVRRTELQTWFSCALPLLTWLQTLFALSRKWRHWTRSVLHELSAEDECSSGCS